MPAFSFTFRALLIVALAAAAVAAVAVTGRHALARTVHNTTVSELHAIRTVAATRMYNIGQRTAGRLYTADYQAVTGTRRNELRAAAEHAHSTSNRIVRRYMRRTDRLLSNPNGRSLAALHRQLRTITANTRAKHRKEMRAALRVLPSRDPR